MGGDFGREDLEPLQEVMLKLWCDSLLPTNVSAFDSQSPQCHVLVNLVGFFTLPQ